MNTKRFILMLLVMLMSVTGAWAEKEVDYTFVSWSALQAYHGNINDLKNDQNYVYFLDSPDEFVIDVQQAIRLQSYIMTPYKNMNVSTSVEGSNDKSSWTMLRSENYSYQANIPIKITIDSETQYRYYRFTIIHGENSLLLQRLQIFDMSLDGEGTTANPYLIGNIKDLQMFFGACATNPAACGKLTTDLDMTNKTWNPEDDFQCTGTLDGNNHVISNLTSSVSLFRSTGAATIKNLGMVNFDISSNDAYCGAFAAQAEGTTFINCYAVGSITGSAVCGGLVGMATNNTQLTQCYSVTDLDDGEIRPTFVSSTNTGSYQNQPAQNLVDNGGVDTRWIANKTDMVDGVWNIVVTTGRAIKLKSIKLWNADNQQYPRRRWKSMKVYGSASSDGEWTEIGSFPNLQLAANNKGLAGEVAINATEKYAYYRIDVLDNEGDNYMQMSDMKFVTTAQPQHLPVCGSSDGSCTANLCYHYGSTSSDLSSPVEQADVTSGRLAYLLNNGDYKGPYFQRIGTDAYPHLTNTGDGYVYLAYDDVNYTNTCPHRDCTIYPFKAPTCIDIQGQAEYGKCHNSLCGKYFPTLHRNAVTTNTKNFILSGSAVNIQEHYLNGVGQWKYSPSKDKGDTPYYNVMELTIERYEKIAGDYEISYTALGDEPTMNLHLFFYANMNAGSSFSFRFYVNDVERTALRKNYPHSISEQHAIITFDGLQKFDCIKVVLNFANDGHNGLGYANVFIGKEYGQHHSLHKHELNYNCIDGGYREYYECDRCTYVFAQNAPESDDYLTTLSALALAPVGSHNFATRQVEGNLYGGQCQNEYCTTFDPDKYVLQNYNNGVDVPLTYDGSTYTAKESVNLKDAEAYITPISFSAPSLTYNRTFYPNVWNPWFVPFNTTIEELADNGVTDVAVIESIHNYDMDEDGVVDKTVLEVIKKTSGTVKAGVPYMVKSGESYTYPMAFTEKEMDASTNTKTLHSETISAAYDFMGTYSGLTAEEVTAASIFSLNDQGAMVHRTGSILPQRWFMKEVAKENVYEELSPAMARAISIRVIGEEDESTGIRTIYPEDEQKEELLPEGIFDLNGRKLSAPQPGKINIINGKKQFVK